MSRANASKSGMGMWPGAYCVRPSSEASLADIVLAAVEEGRGGVVLCYVFVDFFVMCDVEQYLHSGASSCLAGTNFVKQYGAIWEPHQFVHILYKLLPLYESFWPMIFANSYVDPVQIAAIVRIAVWQPNQFVLNLAPILFI
jgi:hypothetical protein